MQTPEKRIQLNILPADKGDCIHLRFQSEDGWHNIVVDSGPAAAASVFRTLLKQISAHGENVDLLCFSHIDDDHIKGAAQVMASSVFDPSIIRQIWLNVPDSSMPDKKEHNLFSPKSVSIANHLLQSIVNYDIPCETMIVAGKKISIGDAMITVALPTQERLDDYYKEWERQVSKAFYQPQATHRDTSPTNGASIVLICSIGNRSILLTGDAFPNDLAHMGKQQSDKAGFSIVKLPHHGSDANITIDMLTAMGTRDFIISTKQTPQRPGRRAMALISAYGEHTEGVTIYGNYDWPRYSANIPNATIIHPKTDFRLTRDRIEVYSDASSTLLFTE